MIALRILDIKKLTAALLIRDAFDDYLLTEGMITTFCTFQIDGRLEKEFYPEAEGQKASLYIRWKMVKQLCFDIIRGKKTPLAFRFVLFYPEEKLAEFLKRDEISVNPANVAGLCINLRFDGTNLLLTSGTSMKSFTTDRSCDIAWDREVLKLMDLLETEAEQL